MLANLCVTLNEDNYCIYILMDIRIVIYGFIYI